MDITIKGLEGVTEAEVKEWVAVLIERKETVKLNSLPEVVTAQAASKVAIDTFRDANGLPKKFELVNELPK